MFGNLSATVKNHAGRSGHALVKRDTYSAAAVLPDQEQEADSLLVRNGYDSQSGVATEQASLIPGDSLRKYAPGQSSRATTTSRPVRNGSFIGLNFL